MTRELIAGFGYRMFQSIYIGANLSAGNQRYQDGYYYRFGLGYEVGVSLPLIDDSTVQVSFRRMVYEADGNRDGTAVCSSCPKPSVEFDNRANYVGIGLARNDVEFPVFLRLERLVHSTLGVAVEESVDSLSGGRTFVATALRVPEPDFVLSIGVRF